jgi:Polyketide cyclase / dehydrase and lipid transport
MSVTITVCTTIDAPPAAVWASVERIESHVDWMKDAVRITFTSAQHRGVGAAFECLTRIGPLSTNDKFVVTTWQPGEVMGIEHLGAVTGTAEFRLHADGDHHTHFCWEERLRFPWWLGGVVGERVGGPVLRRLWTGNVARLKASIEHAG